jgi:deoxyribodipyrimidine photo-lyase
LNAYWPHTALATEPYPPTLAAAQARIAAVRPAAYARTRNAIDGCVSGLSPYITHGLVSLADVLGGVAGRHALAVQHKFVYELGWRAYFRHVWQHRGKDILRSLHEGPLPDATYATELPADIRQGSTGVPAIDQAVRTLHATGMLHNHARMWLASYVVHVRKVHWRCGADWLYGHLLDGDLASNHLSWQWVAGTGSHKPYLFNAENVARHAPESWHSPGSVIDVSYEALDRLAREPAEHLPGAAAEPEPSVMEPPLRGEPPVDLGSVAADPALVKGREVWLVHPWNLGALPALAPGTLVLGVFVSDFHSVWPWSDRRWRFVGTRMAELSPHRWHDDAAAIGDALAGARRVRSVDEPHLAPWLARWAECVAPPALFPPVAARCDSFSQWWSRASRGLQTAADLLAVNEVPAW